MAKICWSLPCGWIFHSISWWSKSPCLVNVSGWLWGTLAIAPKERVLADGRSSLATDWWLHWQGGTGGEDHCGHSHSVWRGWKDLVQTLQQVRADWRFANDLQQEGRATRIRKKKRPGFGGRPEYHPSSPLQSWTRVVLGFSSFRFYCPGKYDMKP